MGDQSGDGQQFSSVEERLIFLEREANFWRAKFEELEKWRENLEEWVLTNFGFHIRTNTVTPGAPAKLNSFFSNLSNGWSPASSDMSPGHPDGGVKKRGRRKKSEIDYKDGEEQEDTSNNVPVPKRKRGRPKKIQAVSVITCARGPNTTPNARRSDSTPEIKSDSNENTQWETEGENGVPVVSVPAKRGRGRPKKIRTENGGSFDDEGDKLKKKAGRKKREPGMPYTKTCDVCGLELENNQELLAHKRVVHPEKFHKCTICNEIYLHAGFLARHMETHTLDRDYKCHLCISSFNTYQLLKTHCMEKHSVDLGRQSDWKRDSELAFTLKQEFSQQGSNEGYGLQPSRPQSQNMISSPASCGGNGNDSGRNDLLNHARMSPHPQLHSIIQQHSHHQQQQLHHQHHIQQQQNSPPPPHVHHSQQLQQQSHHLHQQHHHHHHQQHRMNHRLDDDDDVDLDSNFPLDFGANGSDTLPPLFDPSSNDVAMNNYLNNIESDALQLY